MLLDSNRLLYEIETHDINTKNCKPIRLDFMVKIVTKH